jgi:O-antigen/teichoic acid export membrane protein
LNKETTNKLLAQLLLGASQIAFPLITYPVDTNAIGPEGLGKVNFTDSLLQVFLILAGFGIPIYGIREIAINKNSRANQSRIFLSLARLQVYLLIPATVIFWLVGIAGDADRNLMIVGTIALVAGSFSFEWFLQGNEKFVFLAIRSVIIKAISAILIWTLVSGPADYVLYYVILTGGVVLVAILNIASILPQVRLSSGLPAIKHNLAKLKWIYGCHLFATLYAFLDSILLGLLSSDETVGYYSFGYRLVRMSGMLLPILGVVFIPRVAYNFFSEEKKEVSRHIDYSLQLTILFGLPVTVFLYVLAPEIVYVFSGQEFERTIMVIRLLSPVAFLVALSHLTGSQVLLPVKKEKVYFNALVAGIILNVILNLVLIPGLFEQGAAIANLVAELTVVVLTGAYLIRKNFLRIPLRMLVFSLLASCLVVPVAYLFRTMEMASLPLVICSVLSTGIIYMVFYFWLFPRNLFKTLFTKKPVHNGDS